MRISVLIPTYNSGKTIEATLESVFSQRLPPDEILVMDDGSTDNTVPLLSRHIPRVTLFEQRNGGVAHARNVLVQRASGDFMAFLDHDDLWHPEYLATQAKSFENHPEAVGFFTAHDNLVGHGSYAWNDGTSADQSGSEVISALDFLRQYHKAIGKFASMSFCCVPKRVLTRLGAEPFCLEASGGDDFYFFHALMLLGPIVFNLKALVAYRITPGAQSASLLKSLERALRAMEMVEPRFRAHSHLQLRKAFYLGFSSHRREYGRVLMGVGKAEQARKQLLASMTHSRHPVSLAKSLVWLLLTGVPDRLQPKWPSEWRSAFVPCAKKQED